MLFVIIDTSTLSLIKIIINSNQYEMLSAQFNAQIFFIIHILHTSYKFDKNVIIIVFSIIEFNNIQF